MSIDILMDEMQPIVWEKKSSDSLEETENFALAGFFGHQYFK